MKRPGSGARLIIVCGLPGSGKTTHAKRLQAQLRAIRFCPDEWMGAFSLDIWDERIREKIEGLQWRLAQELLLAGLTTIIEWGTWARHERNALRSRARELGASVELHYLSTPVRHPLRKASLPRHGESANQTRTVATVGTCFPDTDSRGTRAIRSCCHIGSFNPIQRITNGRVSKREAHSLPVASREDYVARPNSCS